VKKAGQQRTTTASSSTEQAPKSPSVKMFEGLRAEIDQSKTNIDVVWAVADEKSLCCGPY
jgi:hypothetical protein